MLDEIQEFVNEYHVLKYGLIALGVIFAVTVCFRTLWGSWKHKDKCKIIKK